MSSAGRPAPSRSTTSSQRSIPDDIPRLLAITGASNVTGWLPPIDAIIEAAHQRGIPVLLDAAQLAPHRPLPEAADYLAFSGHKLYAPFGSGALIGRARPFETATHSWPEVARWTWSTWTR